MTRWAHVAHGEGAHRFQLWTGKVVLAVISLGLGARLVRWALDRGRSPEPAVAFEGERLLLHVHPGRRIRLTRADITDVGAIEPVSNPGMRWAHGVHACRIHTAGSGPRTQHLLIGDRMVASPLDEVRARIADWHVGNSSSLG